MILVDIIIYCILLVVLIFAIWFELRTYNCENGRCEIYDTIQEHSHDECQLYVNYLKYQSSQSLWIKCFIIALIITFIVFWWFSTSIPHILHFVALFLFIFAILYLILYNYHTRFNIPTNKKITKYLKNTCHRSGNNSFSDNFINNHEHSNSIETLSEEYSMAVKQPEYYTNISSAGSQREYYPARKNKSTPIVEY